MFPPCSRNKIQPRGTCDLRVCAGRTAAAVLVSFALCCYARPAASALRVRPARPGPCRPCLGWPAFARCTSARLAGSSSPPPGLQASGLVSRRHPLPPGQGWAPPGSLHFSIGFCFVSSYGLKSQLPCKISVTASCDHIYIYIHI